MRKFLSAFCLALVLAFALTKPASAQVSFHLGPKLGLNYSTVIAQTQNLSPQYATGFVGGAFARLAVVGFVFQPELLLSAQNSNISIPSSLAGTGITPPPGVTLNQGRSFNVNVTNLDVPLMVGFQPLNLKLVSLRFLVGPVASFKLASTGLDNILVGNVPQGTPQSTNDFVRNASWGIAAGAGIDVWKLTADLRYQVGLSSLYDLRPLGLTAPSVGFFQFTIGFKII
jgi:hypothetical protein